MRTALGLAMISCLASACPADSSGGKSGDAGPGSGDASGSSGSKADGPVLWSGEHAPGAVRATDSASGTTLAMLDLPTDPKALAIGADEVWVGTDDGDLRAIDPKTGEVTKMLHIGGAIEQIAVASDAVFVAHFGGGSSGLPPQIVRVDPKTVAETDRFAVVEVNENHDGLIVDGTSLVVLVGNGFAIERVDAQTGKVTKKTPLGEDPSDPSGPRGQFYGYGSLASAGSTFLVLDEDNNKVLAVDGSLTVTAIKDATSWLMDGGATALTTDGKSVFVSLKDSNSLVRLDPKTGAVSATYPYKQGAGPVAYKDAKLYMDADESYGDVLVIDSADGKVLRTIPGVFANDLLAVQ